MTGVQPPGPHPKSPIWQRTEVGVELKKSLTSWLLWDLRKSKVGITVNEKLFKTYSNANQVNSLGLKYYIQTWAKSHRKGTSPYPWKIYKGVPLPPPPQRGEYRELKQIPFCSDARQAEVRTSSGSGLFGFSAILFVHFWDKSSLSEWRNFTNSNLTAWRHIKRKRPHLNVFKLPDSYQSSSQDL